jgi:drug/metabolite transporter (DMT)-like permease
VPPILFVLAAALLWSTGGLFIKATPLDAFQLSFGRALFAAVTVAVLTRHEGFRLNGLTLVSSVLYAALLLLFVMANKLTTAANAIFLQYTAPLYVLATCWYWSRSFSRSASGARTCSSWWRAWPGCLSSSSGSSGRRTWKGI